MANSYDRGDCPRCYAKFYSIAGVLTDPTTVIFRVKNPPGVVTVYTYGVDPALVKISTGYYRIDVNLNLSGDWYYRYEGTGVLCAAGENRMFCRDSDVIF